MHPLAARNAEEYLRIADRVFGDRLHGLYVVGSVAMDAFRPGRSDLDVIVVLTDEADGDCRRIRRVQLESGVRVAGRAVRRGDFDGVGTCNGVYVTAPTLSQPVTEIVPVGSHTGIRSQCGSAFDVNPVVWKTFADVGITLRGPRPADLGLDPQPELIQRWNLDNLDAYWRPLAARLALGRPSKHSRPYSARWQTAWTVLGTSRLHRTVATGEVVSKEAAGEHALETFDTEWHPIIHEALAYWRHEPLTDPGFADRHVRRRTTGEFGLHVVDAAHALPQRTV